uniref:Uncharacterized protein n=1 Tax=Oryza barthii TaxID=65489 RepID=A0A0D3HSL2_9ORYZ
MVVVGNDAVLHLSEEKWKEPVLEQWWRPSRCRGRSGGDRSPGDGDDEAISGFRIGDIVHGSGRRRGWGPHESVACTLDLAAGQELGRYLGRKWPAVEVAVLPRPSSTLAWHRHPKTAKGFLKLSPTPKVCFVSLNRASYC